MEADIKMYHDEVRVMFSTPFQTFPGAHPASCTVGTGAVSRGSSGWGVSLTTEPIWHRG